MRRGRKVEVTMRARLALALSVLVLAAAHPLGLAVAGTVEAGHPVATQQSPVVQALRCRNAVDACLHACRVSNRQADRQCHGVLQEGSCKPNPGGCTCWATPPSCTPRSQ